MKKWVFIHLRTTALFLLLCSFTNVHGSVNIERTIYLTVGSSTTINPWSVVSSSYSDYSCISTRVMGVSDNTALSVSTSSTTTTRYPTLYQTTGYSDGFYSTYKVQALKAGSYTVNTYAYCTKREGYMPTKYIIGDFFVLYHVVVTEAPKVTQISIPNNLTLTVGESYIFSPVIYETGASTTLSWNSSNPSIVSVNNGHIQALLPGSSNITCTASNGVSASCLVTVNPIFVTNISLNQTEIELGEGGKYNLAVTIIPENATNKGIEWRSSNENIAFVGTNGTVVGVSSGYCNITANTTDGSNKSAGCIVHVFKPVYAESITLEYSSVEIIKGEKFKLTPIVTPSNTSNTSYTWTTNSPSCASVDNNGVVTALNEGTATITVTTNDGTNLSASCVFNVKYTTNINSISQDNTTNLYINLHGQRIYKPRKGINIINQKKVIVK